MLSPNRFLGVRNYGSLQLIKKVYTFSFNLFDFGMISTTLHICFVQQGGANVIWTYGHYNDYPMDK